MAEVKLNRKLNLTLDWDSVRGKAHIFSMPISRTVFEDHFVIISRAYAALYANGLGPVAGARVAALFLRQEAEAAGQIEKADTLMAEIHRLTNVLAPATNGGGFDVIPFGEAIARKLFDEDDISEINGALSFFTLVLWMTPKANLEAPLMGLSLIWQAQTTSLPLMEYKTSLPTSTSAEPTGQSLDPPATSQSSIPS